MKVNIDYCSEMNRQNTYSFEQDYIDGVGDYLEYRIREDLYTESDIDNIDVIGDRLERRIEEDLYAIDNLDDIMPDIDDLGDALDYEFLAEFYPYEEEDYTDIFLELSPVGNDFCDDYYCDTNEELNYELVSNTTPDVSNL